MLAVVALTGNQASATMIKLGEVSTPFSMELSNDVRWDDFKDIVKFSFSGVAKVGFDFIEPLVNIDDFRAKLQVRVGHHWETLQKGADPFSLVVDTATTASNQFRWVFKGDFEGGGRGHGHGGGVGSYGVALTVAAVPEPEEWVLLTVGLAMVGYQIRRKQHSFDGSSLSA